MKAFIINRIGDFFFLIGLILLYDLIGTFDYSILFLALKFKTENVLQHFDSAFFAYPLTRINFFNLISLSTLETIGICFFIGAMSKSAQIFLHT